MGYIYKIINTINNKVYIGKTTKTVEERFKAHCKNAEKGINRYLYDAMNHYGINNFVVETLEECNNEFLDKREKYWISFYKSTLKTVGYNMTPGGEGGNTWTNNPHKEETTRKSKETKIKNGTLHNGGNHNPSPNKGQYKINIDKDELLKDLLNKELAIKDIAHKYHCSTSTIRARSISYFGKYKLYSDLRHLNNTLSNDDLEWCINNNLYKKEVKKKYNISDQELDRICLKKYGKKYTELVSNTSKGNYKNINKEVLFDLLNNKELTKKEICKKLNISLQTLENKCLELFDMTVNNFRNIDAHKHTQNSKIKMSKLKKGKTYNEIYLKEVANKMKTIHMNKWLGENNPNYVDVDEIILLSMIISGNSNNEIASYFHISKPTIYAKCELYFGTRRTKEVKKLWQENSLILKKYRGLLQ